MKYELMINIARWNRREETMNISIKRVYEPPAEDDGLRVLVDRLWPRGLSKEKVKADLWLKEVAPSHELRRWFHHESTLWEEFRKRYLAELGSQQETVHELLKLTEKGKVTLLYSASNEEQNQAVVLRDYLQQLQSANDQVNKAS